MLRLTNSWSAQTSKSGARVPLALQLVADYRAAFEKGTCQAGRVDLLMLDGSLGWAQEKASPAATVLDGCSDPAGWLKCERAHLMSIPRSNCSS